MTNQPATLAVLFSDVSGSTRLYEALGDNRAMECIALCMRLMREATLAHNGRVIKTIGDELMCVFATATAAAKAATEMQSRVSTQQDVDGHRLAIRTGFQYGPVIQNADDVFGDGVNVASRLVGLAKSGQIITTRESADTLAPDIARMARYLDTVPLKGRQQEVAICELVWQQSEDATMFVRGAPRAAPAQKSKLSLRLGEQDLPFDASRGLLKLGRDAASDIVLTDRMASREHARIEWRGDNYVLVDLSSNGTYLRFDDQAEIKLKRDQVVLYGHGSISFGHAHGDDPAEAVSFDVRT